MSQNPIWEYFTKDETNASKARCCQCDKMLSLGSTKPSKQTVHGLKYHLEKTHKELYGSFLEKVHETRRCQEPPAKKLKQEEASVAVSPIQLSLQACSERSAKWTDDQTMQPFSASTRRSWIASSLTCCHIPLWKVTPSDG